MIVADTNLLIHLLVDGPNTQSAMDVRKKDSDWRAPFLWKSEFRNAMTGYVRRNFMTVEQAIRIIGEAESIMFYKDHLVNSTDVMRLVSQPNCSAYDCEFVALAQHLDAPLITSDSRLLRDFPSRALAPDRFLA